MKKRTIMFGVGMALMTAMFAAVPAWAGNSTAGTKIGILTCNAIPESGVNLLIHSTVDVSCSFRSTDGSGVEEYVGETGVGLGIDFRVDRERQLVFTVFAADTTHGSYKLAGKYVGAGGSATVGVGVGAQVLVGGSNKSVSLQPVIEGSTGIGVSAGVTYLYLQAKK